jgi:hypothetical protein
MWPQEYVIACLTLMLLAFVQNVSFSVVSRSRNRNNLKYHLIAAFFSNATWYLTFRSLVTANMSLDLFWWYCAGTMVGSATGVKISMHIEKWLRIGSDDHLKQKPGAVEIPFADIVSLRARVAHLEKRFPDRFFSNIPGGKYGD